MGYCFSGKKIKIKTVNKNDQDEAFNCLRPKGGLILRMDSVYNVPKIDILFDEWYTNSVRLWPKTERVRKHFSRIERTPPDRSSSKSYDIISFRYCLLMKC